MESKTLMFRKFNNNDFDDLNELLSNPKVCEYLPGQGGKQKEEVEKWLMHFIRSFNGQHDNQIYAILEQGKTKVIGYGGLGYVKEFDEMEIMYGFNESVWGKGYATETSLKMKELAIVSGLRKVIALADIGNIASQKVLSKTGFKEVKQIHIWGLECYYYEMDL